VNLIIKATRAVGESSGKASRSIARHIPGPSTLDPSRMAAGSAAAAVSNTMLLLNERGEKLSQVEDRTEMMAESARQYGDGASSLLDKYKNKKWYQI